MAEAYRTTDSAGSTGPAAAAAAVGSDVNNNESESSSSAAVFEPVQSTPLGRVNSLIQIARSGTSYAPAESTFLPDYVPLPDGMDDTTYTIDRNGCVHGDADDNTPEDNMQCPDQLEDMLVIVRNLREKRYMAHHNLASIMTQAEAEEAKPKQRANNLVYTNMSDLEDLEE